MIDVTEIRRAILAATLDTSNFGEAPELGTIYVPPAHIKALRLESNLIVGARGVGKSFWTSALGSPDLRALLGSAVRELDRAKVRIGFSVQGPVDDYPNADGFAQMIVSGIDPYDIWRAVVIRWLAGKLGENLPSKRWSDTVDWMKTNPEDAARLVQRAHGVFETNNQYGLIVFDALDRTSNDWREMDSIVRGLLRTVLWLKSYPRLHAKVFLREDQFERTVTDFPDSSKLLATKAELTWARHDLHGLLWQRLINAPDEHGQALRALYRSVIGSLPRQYEAVYQLPDDLKRETVTQRALFERLAGPWMGKDRRRGVPYTWPVGHLADSRGQTSPRSFLAAIKQAAEDSKERYAEHPLALHYESIKRGIQKASEIRINEMAEDYPWVRVFLECLRGMNVPCEYSSVHERWRQAYPDGPSRAGLPQGPTSVQAARLPPQHVERGWDGVRDDLIRLGVMELKKDGRIDMPDLYRVGFGLGRKGGVKPKS